MGRNLSIRWLGRVSYNDGYWLQKKIFEGREEFLLLLEHPKTYTLGVRADRRNVLVDPAKLGAALVETDRGGDVTYHGPGQLVGYPILDVETGSSMVPRFVHRLESALIRTLLDFGIEAFSLEEYPGVWVGTKSQPRKIAAIGVKISRGRSMHGFALNVSTDLSMFDHIIPCGISDKAVTSMEAEGVVVPLLEVGKRVSLNLSEIFGFEEMEYYGIDDSSALSDINDVASVSDYVNTSLNLNTPVPVSRISTRMQRAGVNLGNAIPLRERKPEWMRNRANMGSEYRQLKSLMRSLSLTTVCEEAGCPNIFECWADGTATFMINGESCTRACAFCLVDTSKPLPLDPDEPFHVAEAVEKLGLEFAVVTAVARDDLEDGGANAFAKTIEAIRLRNPNVGVEVLIPDCKGDDAALNVIFAAHPEVLNHNVETPLRLQRAIRPSASYARSLSVLARAKEFGLVTKSGIMVGLGETIDELKATLADLRQMGVSIVTIGQYLRPTKDHAPMIRYYSPSEFSELKDYAYSLGFSHVEASPMARSSYHARKSAALLV